MRPTRLESWFVHASALAVAGTGLVYAGLRYFVAPADPFAVVNHPWQPAVQHLHVLAAPLVVFALGLLWRDHVWRGVRTVSGARRITGLGAALPALPMIASGYLLQVAVEEAWRTTWIAVHVAASVLWLAAYVAHLPLLSRWRRRSRARGPGAEEDQGGGSSAPGDGERGSTGPSGESTPSKRRAV
ncbi:MAG: hypothetical protein AB1726_10800 [Planctomycetota bacterium]